MNARHPMVLPLAAAGEAVSYVVIDDEPRYRVGLGASVELITQLHLVQVGGYTDVETFLAVQTRPCHVVVLDLCLNRQPGGQPTTHGVRAVRHLAGDLGHRVLVHTADTRPEPVARCVAAGAVGYVSKYQDDTRALATAVAEVARHGRVHSRSLTDALRQLLHQCRDIRLSDTLEATLVLLDRGLTDAQIAQRRHLSVRTIADHKRKILEVFGADMEARQQGFADLAGDLGVAPGDLVNDTPGSRPARGLIRRALSWARGPERAAEE